MSPVQTEDAGAETVESLLDALGEIGGRLQRLARPGARTRRRRGEAVDDGAGADPAAEPAPLAPDVVLPLEAWLAWTGAEFVPE